MLQVPIQLASAALMLASADWAEARLKEADIISITVLFFALVLLAATQDIAVDGWALTLLSRQNIGCAALKALSGTSSASPSAYMRHYFHHRHDSILWLGTHAALPQEHRVRRPPSPLPDLL